MVFTCFCCRYFKFVCCLKKSKKRFQRRPIRLSFCPGGACTPSGGLSLDPWAEGVRKGEHWGAGQAPRAYIVGPGSPVLGPSASQHFRPPVKAPLGPLRGLHRFAMSRGPGRLGLPHTGRKEGEATQVSGKRSAARRSVFPFCKRRKLSSMLIYF